MTRPCGLIGYSAATGLGVTNADFFSQLSFYSWLVIPHTRLGVAYEHLDRQCVVARPDLRARDLEQWLSPLSTIFSIEKEYIPGLWSVAKHRGIRIVVMPNVEWLPRIAAQMHLVDLFVAPTLHCAATLRRHGYEHKTIYIPHPIDVHRFTFTPRTRVNSVLHCRGWGGILERKGTDLVVQVAELCPQVSFVVRSQSASRDWARLPANLFLMPGVADRRRLYFQGDLALQPSRWEGVGLQILEAMCSGIPTLVPDAPPMNEYPVDPLLCLPAASVGANLGSHAVKAWEINVRAAAELIAEFPDGELERLSIQSHEAIKSRSWDLMKHRFEALLGMEEYG